LKNETAAAVAAKATDINEDPTTAQPSPAEGGREGGSVQPRPVKPNPFKIGFLLLFYLFLSLLRRPGDSPQTRRWLGSRQTESRDSKGKEGGGEEGERLCCHRPSLSIFLHLHGSAIAISAQEPQLGSGLANVPTIAISRPVWCRQRRGRGGGREE
jgi:hypothetical protein